MNYSELIQLIVVPTLISMPTGVATGLFSSYMVSRYFEFKAITTRASYPLRLFPTRSSECIEELRMCQHQLRSQGFESGWNTMQEILDWAERYRDFAEPEVPQKRHEIMPKLERLRPTFTECMPWSRK
jgi:hypothetical protein